MGQNLDNEQVAPELGIDFDDAQVMASQLREGIVGRKPEVAPEGEAVKKRGGQVVIRMLENVKQMTNGPPIKRTIAEGAPIYTNDGDGFCEVHVNTMEGFRSLLRSWLRPHPGISQERLPLYLGSFEFMHNVRRRGKAQLGSLIELLVAPRNPG